jgi:hypothetical protein
MAGRDDGEFELILGNRQLLSVLFIIILLLGVFFAMGFLAGRSTGASQVVKATRSELDSKPIEIDAEKPADTARPATDTKPQEEAARAETPKRAEPEPPKAEPKQTAPPPAKQAPG